VDIHAIAFFQWRKLFPVYHFDDREGDIMIQEKFKYCFANVPTGQRPLDKPKARTLKKNFFNIYNLSAEGRNFNISSFSQLGMCDPFPDD
jgi:hypothetical protein